MRTGGLFSHKRLTDASNLVILRVKGKDALDAFEPEAGGHRFQGVSPTEKKGRVHSSTVTVAVLQAATINSRALREAGLNKNELRIEAYCGGGPGGQNRNRNATNIRITHLPTGVTACANTKSRPQNEKLALAELKRRLSEKVRGDQRRSRNSKRREQIGSGERSDKIRTVAEQRGRVECHRTGKRMRIAKYERGFIDELH